MSLGTLLDVPEAERPDTYGDDRFDKLTKEVRSLETDVGAAIAAGDDEVKEVATKDTPEGKEYRELRSSVDFGRYVAAAMGGHGVTNGPELELNQHLNIARWLLPHGAPGGRRAGGQGGHQRRGGSGQSRDLARPRVFHGTAAEAGWYQLPASGARRR